MLILLYNMLKNQNHYELGHTTLTEDIIVKLANLYKVTPNVILNYKSKNEIDDIKIVKLLKLIKKENIKQVKNLKNKEK